MSDTPPPPGSDDPGGPPTSAGDSGGGRLAALEAEPGPAAVGVLVAAAGVLFLLEPIVGPVGFGGFRARPVALSAVVLAAGFGLGAVVFSRRGHRRFAFAHAVFGLAWAGVVAGTAAGSGPVVVAAVLLVVAGSGALVTGAGGP